LGVTIDAVAHQLPTTVEWLRADEETVATVPSPAGPVLPGTTAYVIYTSGTRGTPQALIGTRRARPGFPGNHSGRLFRPAAQRL
ncbi:hypothetical protein K4G98_26525, partial [Mycobacterium tuberculosis]|nr:hypothetical protein [Mycobacterium tuberculosis]